MTVDAMLTGATGVVAGVLGTLTTTRVHRARTDARLTWLEDATRASVRMLVKIGGYVDAQDETQELIGVLSQAPRVRG